jgi:curved DNA-binding protein CbpA
MNYKWNIHWKDYYKILQVHPTSGQEVIKAAYELLAKKYHPDLNQEPSSGQIMKDINEAYEVLGTLETRRLYHPDWLKKRREMNNPEAPPITSDDRVSDEQSETTIRPTKTKPNMTTRVKWVIGFVAIFIVISIVIVLKSTVFSSPEIPTSVPVTGTYIVRNLSGGEGKLEIDNGLDLDAYAVLSRSNAIMTPQMGIYIRAGDSFTMTGINDGVFVLSFRIGKNWDGDSKKFLEKQINQRFQEQFEFSTTLEEYTIWEVTLHPVSGGEAQTIFIDENEFPSLD